MAIIYLTMINLLNQISIMNLGGEMSIYLIFINVRINYVIDCMMMIA